MYNSKGDGDLAWCLLPDVSTLNRLVTSKYASSVGGVLKLPYILLNQPIISFELNLCMHVSHSSNIFWGRLPLLERAVTGSTVVLWCAFPPAHFYVLNPVFTSSAFYLTHFCMQEVLKLCALGHMVQLKDGLVAGGVKVTCTDPVSELCFP